MRSVIREFEDPEVQNACLVEEPADAGGKALYNNLKTSSPAIKMTPLSSLTLQKLEYEFNLERETENQTLTGLITDPPAPNKKETHELELLRQLLERKSVGWNEEELKFQFLGPLCRLVNFDGRDSNLFVGRPIQAVISDQEIAGVVDVMFARGRYDPVEPYFCFHEFKKQTGDNSEPAAQDLAAMLVARELNSDGRPVYGAYVSGRTWYFLSLEGEQQVYGYGPSFDAGSDGIFKVFGILRRIREMTDLEGS